MSARRRATRSSVSRKWTLVRVGLPCLFGCQIPAGAWALFIRAGWRQHVECERCALTHYEMRPPNRSFSFHGAIGVDVRDRQTGGDE